MKETYPIDPLNVTVSRLLYCVQESLRCMSAESPLEGVRLDQAAQVAQRMMVESRPLCADDFQGLDIREVEAIFGTSAAVFKTLKDGGRQLEPASVVAEALQILGKTLLACNSVLIAVAQSASVNHKH